MSEIRVEKVTKSFGSVQVLQEFSEIFRDGEFITLLGPSGCGKTTMLRMIAGFEKPSSGRIIIDNTTVSGDGVFIPPEKREIGMVFQSYAVWPHMNVFDNVAYPLKLKKMRRAEIESRVKEILNIVHLGQYASRMPNQLSGGQQQRVALGRALVAAPKLLLLDEPLSNLDAKLRESMRYEIKEIQQRLGITVVYVTHDQVEAMTMSDRVFVINRGVIQQIGSPMEIYRRPANRFVAAFVGKVNFIKGYVAEGFFCMKEGDVKIPYDGPVTGAAVMAVRPENFVVAQDGELRGTLKAVYYLGNENDLRIDINQTEIRVSADPYAIDHMMMGDRIRLKIKEFIMYEDDGQEDHEKILT